MMNFITAVAYHFCPACLQYSRNLVHRLKPIFKREGEKQMVCSTHVGCVNAAGKLGQISNSAAVIKFTKPGAPTLADLCKHRIMSSVSNVFELTDHTQVTISRGGE